MRKTLVTLLAGASIIGSVGSFHQETHWPKKAIISESEILNVPLRDWEVPRADGQYPREEIAFVESFANKPFKEVLRAHLTPRQVGIYCTRVLTHKGNAYDEQTYGEVWWQCAAETHRLHGGDCKDGASAAAALLYPRIQPCVMVMSGEGEFGHVVFLYRRGGLIGTLGINECDVQPPKYHSAEEAMNDLEQWFKQDYTHYVIYTLDWNGSGFIDNGLNNDPTK